MSAYLGAQIRLGLSPLVGALIALLSVFLPGFLLLAAVLPYWQKLGEHSWAAPAMAGVNASVVGLLAAALIDPVWAEGVGDHRDLGIVVLGFCAMQFLRTPVILMVPGCMAGSLLMAVARG